MTAFQVALLCLILFIILSYILAISLMRNGNEMHPPAPLGSEFDVFRNSFSCEECDDSVVKAVYMHFEDWVWAVHQIHIKADDNILNDYAMDDVDLELLVFAAIETCNRKPTEARCHVVNTIRDVVRLVASCPEK